MSDFADSSDLQQDFLVNTQINFIRSQQRELQPNGLCRWCDEPFETSSKKLFCDPDCSGDWEKHKHMVQQARRR